MPKGYVLNKSIYKVETEYAPKAIGPYSQGIVADNFLYVSGQIPINPKTGKTVDGGIENQTVQVMENVEAILKAVNLSLNSVVKCEIFLINMDDFASVNKFYAAKFNSDIKPARQVIGVASLPLNSLIEMSCIAAMI